MRASSDTPVGGFVKPVGRHKRLSDDYKHLSLTDGLRASRKKAGATIKAAAIDPELAAIESTRRCDAAGKILPARCCEERDADGGKQPCAEWKRRRECEHSQAKAWCLLRDAFADKNRDLARRAAHTAWKRNTHLPGEIVACCFEPDAAWHNRPCRQHTSEARKQAFKRGERGATKLAAIEVSHCAWCHGKKKRLCQPDLEALAFAGLLEAIRKFDSTKAGRISSYAVWLIKQSMLELLRQTPVTFPQDLLRDRRELAKYEKALGCDASDSEAAELLEKTRPSRKIENRRDRLALARNCYYGNERKSVEQLQQKYVEQADRLSKRARRGKAGVIAAALSSTSEVTDEARARDALHAAIKALAPDEMDFATDAQYRAAKLRAEKYSAAIEQYLAGESKDLPVAAVIALREAADVRMRSPLRVSL